MMDEILTYVINVVNSTTLTVDKDDNICYHLRQYRQ